MSFDPSVVATLLVASFDLILGGVILAQGPRDRTNAAYAFFALTVALWGFGVGFFLSSVEVAWSGFLARFLYLAGGSIPASFLFFALVFNAAKKAPLWQGMLVFLPTLLFIPLYFLTDTVIRGYAETAGGRGFVYGDLRFLFDLHLWGYFAIAFFVLLRKYLAQESKPAKEHILFIMLGTYIVLAIAGATNVVAPLLSIFDLIWIGPTATVLWIGIVAYAVARHQLFNIRVIATEMLVVSLWIFLLGRVFFSSGPSDLLINLISFAVVLVLGFFLIRGIIKEVAQREHIEVLADHLKTANERLTALDKQKTEFVSFASHQLRAPLTALKGYASLLLEGSYGKLAPDVAETIGKMSDSSRNMALMVEDFLNVSRIELGIMKYDKKDFDLCAILTDIGKEFASIAAEKKIAFALHCPPEPVMVHGDSGKLTQVLTNVIDNSIKYTPAGEVRVGLAVDNAKGVAVVSVHDTGVGIPQESLTKLFEKFVRGKNANEANTQGTGLGLFIARQFVEAHDGRLWAESEGPGRGAAFFIELPRS